MSNLNIYDKLWFSDVKALFNEKGYNMTYDTSKFKAFKRTEPSCFFTINITANEIIVSIPFQSKYQYKTSFTEYFKVAEFLIYHIKDNHNKKNDNYDIISNQDLMPNTIISN
tara:strand:- start:5855 stop:6190 length:336 start_codon:yes stop_codon:yes gene_type:complete